MGQLLYSVDAITRKMSTSDPSAVIVEDDHNATLIKFSAPDLPMELTKVNGTMLYESDTLAYVYFQYGDEIRQSTCSDLIVTPQMFQCTWKIPREATENPGKLRFQLCVRVYDRIDWNSIPETLEVVDGINHEEATFDVPTIQTIESQVQTLQRDVEAIRLDALTKPIVQQIISESLLVIDITSTSIGSDDLFYNEIEVGDIYEKFIQEPEGKRIICRVNTDDGFYDLQLASMLFQDPRGRGTVLIFNYIDPVGMMNSVIRYVVSGSVIEIERFIIE